MLPNRYDFREAEPRLARFWAENNTYAFDSSGVSPAFTIDTPPPTVSGHYTWATAIRTHRRM